jgi:hypothetical protein
MNDINLCELIAAVWFSILAAAWLCNLIWNLPRHYVYTDRNSYDNADDDWPEPGCHCSEDRCHHEV